MASAITHARQSGTPRGKQGISFSALPDVPRRALGGRASKHQHQESRCAGVRFEEPVRSPPWVCRRRSADSRGVLQMAGSGAANNHGWRRKGYGATTACSRRARTELSFCLGERILDSAPVPRTPHRQLPQLPWGTAVIFSGLDLSVWSLDWAGHCGRWTSGPSAASPVRQAAGGDGGEVWRGKRIEVVLRSLGSPIPASSMRSFPTSMPALGGAGWWCCFDVGDVPVSKNSRHVESKVQCLDREVMGGESVLAAPVVVTRRHYSCFMQSKCAPQFVRRLNMNNWGFVQCEASRFWGVPDILPVRANEW